MGAKQLIRNLRLMDEEKQRVANPEAENQRLREALEQADYAAAHLHDDRFTVRSIRLGIEKALVGGGDD